MFEVKETTRVVVHHDAAMPADIDESVVVLQVPGQSIMMLRDDHLDHPGLSGSEQGVEPLALDNPER